MIYHFPTVFDSGLNILLQSEQHPDANMDLAMLVLNEGQSYEATVGKEQVAVLCSGKINIQTAHLDEVLERSDVFHGEPIVIRTPSGTGITIKGLGERSEILLVATDNKKTFDAEIMYPQDMLNPSEERARGLMNDAAVRVARTYFDRSIRSNTNFFIGEVVMEPGKWSSFPPHYHPETEFYFYKFLPENGYGYAEVDGDVHKVKQHSLTVMSKGEPHPQVTAPAYAEWYLWCIRLDDHKPLVTTFVAEHEWANDPHSKLFPELKS